MRNNQFKDEDIFEVCPFCYAEVEEKHMGDEGWTFCSEDCGCLEGVDLLQVTESELDKLLGGYDE